MRHFGIVILIICSTFFYVAYANDSHSYVQRSSANSVSGLATESDGNKSDNDATAKIDSKPFVYDNSTFSSQREMLDFIKTLDFDRNPPAKRLSDFYNNEKKIPADKVLGKGIELYQKGNARKAADYFVKIYKNTKKYTQQQRDYAAWQVAHYILFGTMDVYYDGRPSRMNRNIVPAGHSYECNTYLSLGFPYLFVISEPGLPSYDPTSLLKSLTSQEELFNKVICQNPHFTQEFLAAALYEAFPKGAEIDLSSLIENDVMFGTSPFRYEVTGDLSSVKMADLFVESVVSFFNIMDCIHLVARTKSNITDEYGIGLTADELYKKAKRLNPYKQMDLISFTEGIKNFTDNDAQCQKLLLRSAYFGHPDATLELMPYIVETVQYGYSWYIPYTKKWQKWYKEDGVAAGSAANGNILDSVNLILKALSKLPQFKNTTYIWEAMIDEVNFNRKNLNTIFLDNLHAKEAEKRAKKERRKQFWSNMGNTILDGLARGVNSYMQTQYQASVPMNMTSQMAGNYTGSLADAMSQPGYFQNVQQQLLQQSMNQVQWAEMQEYNAVRENFQRMGRDLTLNDFRALKGQAIADMKAQGYDIIAEQKAINDELFDSNRSAMNSGKENVNRIKRQNAAKSGSANAASTNKSNSTQTSARSSSQRCTSTATSTTKATDNNSGAANAYVYKQRKVNLHENPNSNSAIVFRNCEVYQKGSHYFVKIGEQYYQVQNCNKRYYNRTVMYGSHPYYFNM